MLQRQQDSVQSQVVEKQSLHCLPSDPIVRKEWVNFIFNEDPDRVSKNSVLWKWKWKWRDIRPSMVTHTRNLCSAFNPSKVHTHSIEHTHTVNTHPEQWAAIYAAAPGEQLGVRCLAQGHRSRGIEGGESTIHSLPPPTIPAGPEARTRKL